MPDRIWQWLIEQNSKINIGLIKGLVANVFLSLVWGLIWGSVVGLLWGLGASIIWGLLLGLIVSLHWGLIGAISGLVGVLIIFYPLMALLVIAFIIVLFLADRFIQKKAKTAQKW